MEIAFTGHRDKQTSADELDTLRAEFPGATWIHGGADGFDSQVDVYARAHAIPTDVRKPDYKANGRAATFIRNRQIVDAGAILIACYDGRKTGGTADTVKYAHSKNKPVRILRPA